MRCLSRRSGRAGLTTGPNLDRCTGGRLTPRAPVLERYRELTLFCSRAVTQGGCLARATWRTQPRAPRWVERAVVRLPLSSCDGSIYPIESGSVLVSAEASGYLNTLDSEAAVRRLVAFFVEAHNPAVRTRCSEARPRTRCTPALGRCCQPTSKPLKSQRAAFVSSATGRRSGVPALGRNSRSSAPSQPPENDNFATPTTAQRSPAAGCLLAGAPMMKASATVIPACRPHGKAIMPPGWPRPTPSRSRARE